jgi:predicted nucleotidyltransferase
MRYGLEEKVIYRLVNFFEKYSFIDKVVIFGSRVKGTYGKSSDIDLCIFSKTMSSLEFSKLRFELDELPIFHKIDIMHFEKVDSELQENIVKVGKKIG